MAYLGAMVVLWIAWLMVPYNGRDGGRKITTSYPSVKLYQIVFVWPPPPGSTPPFPNNFFSRKGRHANLPRLGVAVRDDRYEAVLYLLQFRAVHPRPDPSPATIS
jgi:hypothetical protein